MASLLPFTHLKPITTITKSSLTSTPSSLIESLNDQFGRKGINFLDSTDPTINTPIVELSFRNGSSLKLHLSNAHITSYKPKVYWKDDGFEEVLYTFPNSKGGVGLVVNDVTQPVVSAKKPDPFRRSEPGSATPKGSVLTGVEWFVKDVDSDSFDAVQVHYLIICLILNFLCSRTPFK